MAKLPKPRDHTPHGQGITLAGRHFVIRGLKRHLFGDFYYRAMIASWPRFFLSAAVVYLGVAAIFALAFWWGARLGYPPVANVQTGGFLDHFYFSVETLATVGYGDMHPQTQYGHILATIEIFLGTMSIAVLTGLVFARFSQPKAQILFTQKLVVSRYDGKPVLMARFANARHNLISDATAKLWMTRLETNQEGARYRRFHALKLDRSENPLFALSWTLIHVIDETSLLHDMDAAALEAADVNLIVTVRGRDETSNDDVHARRIYRHQDIDWHASFADILTPSADSSIIMDYSRFHDTIPHNLLTNENRRPEETDRRQL
ncbi:inward rectifier potassium channel protein [Labrys miyagiensis]|uniref:Inward rectifier potassium channel protein n=1 Tax=Labrys miyagiensis TaxID=346912 RepID=A0ABQ6CGW0_9HYPH|nr:ion channel [Labrys miyagiensis]GLS18938.1 inward rectifier potassium channel protein [Labrys miyagiensis]